MAHTDDAVLVLADLGNANAKIIILFVDEGKFQQKELEIPHGYMPMSKVSWAQEVNNKGTGKQDKTHTFQYVTGSKDSLKYTALKIGKNISGSLATLYGNAKYYEGYIDAYLTAVFCEIFPKKFWPNGHNNIYLGFGVPPSDWALIPKLSGLLTKTHRIVDVDGGKRSFTVRMSMPINENNGGMMQAAHYLHQNKRESQTGKFTSFKKNSDILVVDAGGILGSISWGSISEQGFPVLNTGQGASFAIDGGIVTVRQQLRQALKSYYPEDLQGMTEAQMRDSWLDDIIKDRTFTLGGKKRVYDASEAVDEAVSPYTNSVRQAWGLVGFGLAAEHLILTGGTTDPLFSYFTELYNHGSVLLADKREEIFRANVRGMAQIFIDKLIAENRLPNIFVPFIESTGI